MAERWRRPVGLEFPKIFHEFTAKDCDGTNSKLVEYYVQDLPENLYEDVIEFLIEFYTPDEPMFQCRDARNDPQTVEDFRKLWMEILNVKISQVCFKVGSDEIIGVNLIDVDVKGVDNYVGFEGIARNYKNQCGVVDYCLENSNFFETFKIQKYLRTCEFTIRKEYRNRGIATEMFRAMQPTMEFYHLDLVTTGCSAIGSAKATLKAGYKIIFEMPFENLPKINPEFEYPDIKSPSYKQVYMLRHSV